MSFVLFVGEQKGMNAKGKEEKMKNEAKALSGSAKCVNKMIFLSHKIHFIIIMSYAGGIKECKLCLKSSNGADNQW